MEYYYTIEIMHFNIRLLPSILAVFTVVFCVSNAMQIGSHISGIETPGGYIVNGTEVKPHSYPWQVHLLTTLKNNMQTVCGGVLIGTNWVLTAAHCVSGMSSVELTFGAHIWQDDEPEQLRVTSTVAIRHEEYTMRLLERDIAVIPFHPPLTETEFIQVIPLAFNEPEPGDICTVTGWGLTAEDGSLSDELMEVDVLIADKEHCHEKMDDLDPSPSLEGYICLDTTEYQTPCQGDSGGPLHVTEVDSRTGRRVLKVAGVTSFGAQAECEQAGAVAYTSSVYFEDWIFEKTQITPH